MYGCVCGVLGDMCVYVCVMCGICVCDVLDGMCVYVWGVCEEKTLEERVSHETPIPREYVTVVTFLRLGARSQVTSQGCTVPETSVDE